MRGEGRGESSKANRSQQQGTSKGQGVRQKGQGGDKPRPGGGDEWTPLRVAKRSPRWCRYGTAFTLAHLSSPPDPTAPATAIAAGAVTEPAGVGGHPYRNEDQRGRGRAERGGPARLQQGSKVGKQIAPTHSTPPVRR